MKRKRRGQRKNLGRTDKIELIRLATATLSLIKAVIDLFIR